MQNVSDRDVIDEVQRILCLKYSTRSTAGTTIAEFAPTLWLLFFIFTFPLLAFGTLGVRYAFFLNAARLAATAASQSKSYLVDYSTTQPSAVNLAKVVATQSVKGFSGISLTTVTTQIAICPLAGTTVTRQTTPLAKPADTSVNNYNIEVIISGQIHPLIPVPNSKYLANVPGLTGPVSTSARVSVFAENPQGLNQ